MLSFFPLNWQSYALAFALFRFFDALKPFPISVADAKIKGGFGIMFDDILAAIYPLVIYKILYVAGFIQIAAPALS